MGLPEKKPSGEETESPLWTTETHFQYAATVSRLEAQLEEDKESMFARRQEDPDSDLDFLRMPLTRHAHQFNHAIGCWEDVAAPQPLKPLAEDRDTDVREVKAAVELWSKLQCMLRRSCKFDPVPGFYLSVFIQQDILQNDMIVFMSIDYMFREVCFLNDGIMLKNSKLR